MTIEIWLILFLITSIVVNAVLLWLLYAQSSRLYVISTNIDDLLTMIENYKNHLRKIYEMEMFYGDENLKFLLDHTASLVEILDSEYGDISYITDPLEIEQREDKNAEEDEQEKDVFYAGTRERNS